MFGTASVEEARLSRAELEDAFKRAVRPLIAYQSTQAWTSETDEQMPTLSRATEAPLLDQLHELKYDRSELDLDAVDIERQIVQATGIHVYGGQSLRSPVTLWARDVLDGADGEGLELWTRHVRSWSGRIEALIEPPRTIEIEGTCPAAPHVDDGQRTLRGSVSRSGEMIVRCTACRTVWSGQHEVQQLRGLL